MQWLVRTPWVEFQEQIGEMRMGKYPRLLLEPVFLAFPLWTMGEQFSRGKSSGDF